MKPYLSICMGIGGNLSDDLLERLRNSTRRFGVCEKEYSINMELVVCEWNVSLRDCGKVERAIECSYPTRIIHVPRELHEKAYNPHGFRYFEFFPKNIGIRRARGEFVLSTNPDDLWSEELAAFLGLHNLKHGHFYRVNRHDMRDGKVFRICYPTGAYGPNASEEEIRKPCSPRACAWSEDMLHYSAAGDFTLMSRDDWFAIHGNPEREYSDSIDGQTLWLAHQKGLKQVILPFPLYHPDHERTLNLVDGKTQFNSNWDDHFPHAKMNGEDWGFRNMVFEETVL